MLVAEEVRLQADELVRDPHKVAITPRAQSAAEAVAEAEFQAAEDAMRRAADGAVSATTHAADNSKSIQELEATVQHAVHEVEKRCAHSVSRSFASFMCILSLLIFLMCAVCSCNANSC